jgi:uncharacterized protein (DUF983 family)
MEPGSIVSIILIVGLIFERILKHIKKSKCCGNEMEFNTEASVPDLQSILRK